MTRSIFKNVMTACSAALALGGIGLLTGCNGFFNDPVTTTTTTANSSGDYVYVVNSANNTLSEYVAGSGALTVVSGSPLTMQTGLAGRSVTVSRQDTFVYVGGNGAINGYSIGTGGALTALTAGNAAAVANFVSLDTSPDGKYLLALDGSGGSTGVPALYSFSINASTGALSLVTSVSLQVNTALVALTTPILKVSPAGTSVLVSLNAGGTDSFAFDTSSGVPTYTGTVAATGFYDQSVAYDSTGAFAYVSRSNLAGNGSGISSYSVSATGILTAVQALAASGNAPSSLLFDPTGAYLYDSNVADLTLGAYMPTMGSLTAVSGSPFASGVKVVGLTRDISGKYIIGIGSTGTNDVTLYGFDVFSPAKLNATASISTGAAGVVGVAATRKTADF